MNCIFGAVQGESRIRFWWRWLDHTDSCLAGLISWERAGVTPTASPTTSKPVDLDRYFFEGLSQTHFASNEFRREPRSLLTLVYS